MKGPETIGVIVDGNRRWAKERGYPSLVGHKTGLDNLVSFFDWAHEAGVTTVYAYCFSTENWNRTTEEVNYLMDLFRVMFQDRVATLKEKGYKIRVVGQRQRLAHDLQEMIDKAERDTSLNNKLQIVICLSYGGQDEVLEAVNKLLADKGRDAGPVTKEKFENYLWTAGLPDPDMIIRTGGEHRLSNFLMWRSTYSELFFPEVRFPGFTREDFHSLLKEYSERERRHGK